MTTRAHILVTLRDAKGAVSGEAVATRLGISRTAVAKHIRALREEGYTIRSATRSGYRLLAAPDRLTDEELRPALETQILGRPVTRHFDATDSTNAQARILAGQGCAHGTVVTAEAQSAGRGRRGRAWFSPPGAGIYATLVLRPALAPQHAPLLTLAAGVAIAQALRAEAQVQARIKWPNDVLVDGRKIAGILTETAADSERIEYAIVGFGINVNLPRRRLPPELRSIATSLEAETGRRFSRVRVLAQCLGRMEALFAEASAGRFEAILAPWRDLSNGLGRKVRVETLSGTLRGTVCGVGPDGALLLTGEDGSGPIPVHSGDVTIEE